jgi:hypothetical protein
MTLKQDGRPAVIEKSSMRCLDLADRLNGSNFAVQLCRCLFEIA